MPHWADCAVNLVPAGECDCRNDAPTEGADYLPPKHATECDWHTDQYWWECTCGAISEESKKLYIAQRDDYLKSDRSF